MGSTVERVPHSNPEKIKKLPTEAQTILSLVKNNVGLSNKDYRKLENSFVDIMEFSESKKKKGPKPVLSEKTIYGGQLNNFGLQIVSDLGFYDPDVITYEIKEKMSKDPTIALGLNIIKCTIAGLNWRIDCEDEEQRNFLTTQIKKIYRKSVFPLTDAVRLGNAVGEKVWDNVDGDWVLSKIKFINPVTYRMLIDLKGNFAGVIQRQNGEDKKVLPNKLVLYSHDIQFGNWYGNSRLKNCYPAWYWSSVLTQFMLRYFERRAVPLTIVRAPPGKRTDQTGAQVDNLEHVLKIGQAAVSSSVVALPKEFDKNNNDLWGLEQVKDEQRGDMFMQILDFFDSRKLRGIFIPDKMGLASDGSKHVASGAGAGDTLDVFIMSEQALANDLEDVYNEQIIPDLQKYNFGEKNIKEAYLRIEKLDYNKKLMLKDVFLRMIMLSAGTLRDGRAPKGLPSIKKLAEMLDIPVDTFDLMFDKQKIPKNTGVVTPGTPGSNNVQNNPAPTIDKKKIQDKNNSTRALPRKERTGKERAIKDKRR
jgi:hypothetical protein